MKLEKKENAYINKVFYLKIYSLLLFYYFNKNVMLELKLNKKS